MIHQCMGLPTLIRPDTVDVATMNNLQMRDLTRAMPDMPCD